jgi:hypothetical protein
MALKIISEILEFNDDARQFLNFLHRQMVASSSSIEGAREFLKSARQWNLSGGLPPPKNKPLSQLQNSSGAQEFPF